MAKERIVRVVWEDASYSSGYYDKKEPERFEPVLAKTVGHLVKRTNKAIILATERMYDNKGKITDERHINTIPNKMIKKIIYLEEKK